MKSLPVDRNRIHRPSGVSTPPGQTFVKDIDNVVIQITQAFCPKGHNLMHDKKHKFSGEPGVSLWVSDGETSGEIILSPFHGDHSRQGKVEFKKGTKLTISCPICREPLPELSPCSCPEKGQLVKLFLTPTLDEAHLVGLCNVWGCHRSKVFEQAQLLAAYLQE